MSAELARAHATLCRGADFLPLWMRGLASPRPGHTRVLGNGLRELDRFFSVLLDEAAAHRGRAARRYQHNTANKLHALSATLGRHTDDAARLRALGRSRECLFYCEGIVRRGDTRQASAMTAGWPAADEGALLMVPIGAELNVGTPELESVGAFYRGLADSVLTSF